MPINCAHDVPDQIGIASPEEIGKLAGIATHIIVAEPEARTLRGFREYVLNHPGLGPRFDGVITTIWANAKRDYVEKIRKPGMFEIKDTVDEYIPTYDSFRASGETLDDLGVTNVMRESLRNIAKLGILKEARGGVDVAHNADTAKMAAELEKADLLDPKSEARGVSMARSTFIEESARIIKDLETRQDDITSGKAMAGASEHAKQTAITDLLVQQSFHRNQMELVSAIHYGKATQYGRYIQEMKTAARIANMGVEEAGDWYDMFEGTGDFNTPLETPFNAEAIADAIKPGKPEESTVRHLTTGETPIKAVSPTMPEPEPTRTKPSELRTSLADAGLSVEDIESLLGIKPTTYKDKQAATARRVPAIKEAPAGIKVLENAWKNRNKNEEGKIDKAGREGIRKDREEFKKGMASLYKEMVEGFNEAPSRKRQGYTFDPANLVKDLLPPKAVNAIGGMVKLAIIHGVTEFKDFYRTVRDLDAAVGDFEVEDAAGNKTMVDHVGLYAHIFQTETGNNVPDSIVNDLIAENGKNSAEAYKDLQSQTSDPAVAPLPAMLISPSLAETSRQRLAPDSYNSDPRISNLIQPNGERAGFDTAMSYYGAFVYRSMRKENGKKPTFAQWVFEMKTNTGTDLNSSDLTRTWGKLKEASYFKVVKPKIDAKARATGAANVRLDAEQSRVFKSITKDLKPDDPDIAMKTAEAYRVAKSTGTGGFLSVALEASAIQRTIRFGFDMSAMFSHLAPVVADPRRLMQTIKIAGTALAGSIDPAVYDAAMEPLRDPNDALYEYRTKYGRDQFKDILDNHEEIFSSNLLNRAAEMSYDREAASSLGDAIKNKKVLSFNVPGTRSVPVDFAPTKTGPIRGLTSDHSAPFLSKIEIDPRGGIARSVAAGERFHTLFLNLYRKALFDSTFQNLVEQGFHPDIDEHVFQAGMDNNAIMSGASNLSVDSSEFVKNAAIVASAPRYQISQTQAILRPVDAIGSTIWDVSKRFIKDPNRIRGVEDYKPSNKAVRSTPFHAVDGNAIYLSHYMPPSARRQMLDYMGGAAGGAMISAVALALAGGEVQLDPRHKDFWYARFKNKLVPLPGAAIMNNLKFWGWFSWFTNPRGVQRFAPTTGSPRPGIALPGRPNYRSQERELGKNFAPSKSDLAIRFAAGKAAPAVQTAGKIVTGQDILGQKAYLGRLFSKVSTTDKLIGLGSDIAQDSLPISPYALFKDVTDQKSSSFEKLMALFSLTGLDEKDAKFQKDPHGEK